jgi:hypothetical protein
MAAIPGHWLLAAFRCHRLALTSVSALVCRLTQNFDCNQSQSYVTTDSQSASQSWSQAPIWGPRPDFYYCPRVDGLLMWGALSDEDWCVVYNCCWPSPAQSFSGPSPMRLMTLFYCLRFETPQPVRRRPRIYIPNEKGGPVISPGTGFPFRRLLRLAGLRWRYSNPPPRGEILLQSQSYFTTGGLPPVSSFWRQTP